MWNVIVVDMTPADIVLHDAFRAVPHSLKRKNHSPEQMNDQEIDAIIEAVQRVTADAQENNIEMDQHTVRALILHIVSTLDRITEKCWLHRVRVFFINFLMDERSDEPKPKKFTIPKVATS